jgi:hypothetical protein
MIVCLREGRAMVYIHNSCIVIVVVGQGKDATDKC